MKVKRQPEDFVVTEQTDLQPASTGKFTLYQLEKRGIGTLEAIAAIQQRWKVARHRLSWGGLKDKHAITRQFFTILGGPNRGLEQTNFTVSCLGYVAQPFQPQNINSNRFEIGLRNLTEDQVDVALRAQAIMQSLGVPNYFDDQRFGSMSQQGEFIAEPWMRGDYERALWLTFAEPNEFDTSSEKKEKAILREHWGNWKTCKAELSRSHRRSIITFLDDRPGDFKGAWGTVNKDLRSLYLAAYQSQIWNEVLSLLIVRIVGQEHCVAVAMKSGTFWFPTELNDNHKQQLRDLSIPLPSARISLDDIESELVRTALADVLSRRGIELREIRTKFPRDSFFSKGSRSAISQLDGYQSSVEEDDLYPGRKRLQVTFTLRRGAYATIVVKRLGLSID